jgi:hypothetical protein
MLGALRTLQPGEKPETWRLTDDSTTHSDYRHCANFDSPAGCNWLVTVDEASPFCIACRLNRTLPDLDDSDNQQYWRSIEAAKRRLVSQLLALDLPVESKTENPEQGLAFDILRSPIDGPKVLTSHDNGLITLNAEEAGDHTIF